METSQNLTKCHYKGAATIYPAKLGLTRSPGHFVDTAVAGMMKVAQDVFVEESTRFLHW